MESLVCVILGFLMGAFIVGGVTNGIRLNQARDEAVKHHAAEYYLDSENNRQFRWLDEERKP